MGCVIFYDLFVVYIVQVMVGVFGMLLVVFCGMLVIVGFVVDEVLLLEEDGGYLGLCLFVEYFVFFDKFYFFDLLLFGVFVDGQVFYLYLVFDCVLMVCLYLQVEDFQFGCVLVINFFLWILELLCLDGICSEYCLVVDSYCENSVEIYSICVVCLVVGSIVQLVLVYYGCCYDSYFGMFYWYVWCIVGLILNWLGSDLLLSLVDIGFDLLCEILVFSLIVELLCINCYLVECLGVGIVLGFEWFGLVVVVCLCNVFSVQSQLCLDG